MEIKYFDNAATTPVDEKVLQEMIPYFSKNFGNPSSLYSLGKKNKEIINIQRMKIASIINAKVNEIYFTSSGTESDNLIIKGIAFANKFKGNHIITSKIEHPAVLNSCKFLEKFGFKVTYLSPNSKGIISPEDVAKAINKNTILVSIMYANNEIGTIQPIEKIGSIAKKYNVFFHTDAVQAMGNINIDVRKQNIGALSMSSHKFYGPKGVGVAYINENIPFMRWQDGGHQEKDKRSATENVSGIIGTGKALELAYENLEAYNKHLKSLRDYTMKEILYKIPYTFVNGDVEKRLSGNLNLSFIGIDGTKLIKKLDEKNICASSGSACSAGLPAPSPVLLSIGVQKNLAKSSLRLSFGKENTLDEVKYLIQNLEEIVKELRK